MKRTRYLEKADYQVIEAWACEVGRIGDVYMLKVETKSYPHVILYDFKAYGDNNHRKEPMPTLTIENEHVPMSVSVVIPLKESLPTSVKETPQSLSASLQKSWRDVEKTSGTRYEQSSCQKMCICCQKLREKKLTNGATRFLSSGLTQAVTT